MLGKWSDAIPCGKRRYSLWEEAIELAAPYYRTASASTSAFMASTKWVEAAVDI